MNIKRYQELMKERHEQKNSKPICFECGKDIDDWKGDGFLDFINKIWRHQKCLEKCLENMSS